MVISVAVEPPPVVSSHAAALREWVVASPAAFGRGDARAPHAGTDYGSGDQQVKARRVSSWLGRKPAGSTLSHYNVFRASLKPSG